MAKLIITEFAGLASGSSYGGGTAPQVGGTILKGQEITLAGAHAESTAVLSGTTLIKLFAQAQCKISLGTAPNAETDTAFLVLGEGQIEYLAVPKSGNYKVSAVTYT